MRNIFFYSLILISIFVVKISIAQPTAKLRGIVVDKASELPIPFAAVQLRNTNPIIGTTTDDKGLFQIENIPIGRYDVEVSCLGYESGISHAVLLTSGRSSFVKIALPESAIKMDEVIITSDAEKSLPINKMASVSARQLSIEEANRFAGGFDDPARLVSAFAGVASELTTNGLAIRGNSPKGLLWRMEGVEIPNPNHFGELAGFGGGGITALSSQILANSDFITGAFPAEFGNGLSGVFDLTMRTGNSTEHEHTFSAGFIGIDLSSEGPINGEKQSSYLFNYRYSTLALIELFTPEGTLGGIKYQDLAFKLNFPNKHNGSLSIWGLALLDHQKYHAEEDSSLRKYNYEFEGAKNQILTGIAGATYKQFLGDNTYLKTILTTSINDLSSHNTYLVDDTALPDNNIDYTLSDLTLSFLVNHKFSSSHTNRSGINAKFLNYKLELNKADSIGSELINAVDENGNSSLLQFYSQSTVRLNEAVQLNPGINVQHFTLTGKTSIEPRLGVKVKITDTQNFGIGYGLHSQIEKVNFYFSNVQSGSSTSQPNKKLDFSKAHHVVFAYDLMLNEYTHVSVEPYYQRLFNIPVVDSSYISFSNLVDDFFLTDKLVSKGEGENYGIDITLEQYLHKGWYYLLTTSLFESKYKGGDDVWRNSRFNKRIISNALIGKEYKVGKSKSNFLNISIRYNYSGGNWQHPVNREASLATESIIEDLSKPFSEQKPATHFVHFTISHKKNKEKFASIWSLQILNMLGQKEHIGYAYNFIDNTVDRDDEAIVIPNLSWKIEF